MEAEPRHWTQADLARRSGVSPQVISKLLDEQRDRMTRPPSPETITRLAEAFGGANMEQRLWARVAESMGLPSATEVPVPDAASLSNTELISELTRRLEEATPKVIPIRRLDPDDYDQAAAVTSPEPAGQPQSEEP